MDEPLIGILLQPGDGDVNLNQVVDTHDEGSYGGAEVGAAQGVDTNVSYIAASYTEWVESAARDPSRCTTNQWRSFVRRACEPRQLVPRKRLQLRIPLPSPHPILLPPSPAPVPLPVPLPLLPFLPSSPVSPNRSNHPNLPSPPPFLSSSIIDPH
ncbi:unnamed protein product [Closterium sp. NIES-53]